MARKAYRIGKKRKPAEASVEEPDSDAEAAAKQTVPNYLQYPDLPQTEDSRL